MKNFRIRPEEFDLLAQLSENVIETRKRYPMAANQTKALFAYWARLGKKYNFKHKTAKMKPDCTRDFALVVAEER